MCVSDRVMDGDVTARYNPAAHASEEDVVIEAPADLHEVQGLEQIGEATTEAATETVSNAIGLSNLPESVQSLVRRKEEWKALQDLFEHARLHTALMKHQYHLHKLKKLAKKS